MIDFQAMPFLDATHSCLGDIQEVSFAMPGEIKLPSCVGFECAELLSFYCNVSIPRDPVSGLPYTILLPKAMLISCNTELRQEQT